MVLVGGCTWVKSTEIEVRKLSKFVTFEFDPTTANGYTCLEKLTTEKWKQQAKQPEKKILKIKIL